MCVCLCVCVHVCVSVCARLCGCVGVHVACLYVCVYIGRGMFDDKFVLISCVLMFFFCFFFNLSTVYV